MPDPRSGMLGAVTMGIVMLSPAITIYCNFGPAFIAAGRATPLAFAWALLAMLPTAVSYALLSRDFPESGSAAAWAARAGGERVGVWAGWIVFFYYLANLILQPITFGVFLGDFFTTFGAHPGGWHLSRGRRCSAARCPARSPIAASRPRPKGRWDFSWP